MLKLLQPATEATGIGPNGHKGLHVCGRTSYRIRLLGQEKPLWTGLLKPFPPQGFQGTIPLARLFKKSVKFTSGLCPERIGKACRWAERRAPSLCTVARLDSKIQSRCDTG